jgi:hypothetical protein
LKPGGFKLWGNWIQLVQSHLGGFAHDVRGRLATEHAEAGGARLAAAATTGEGFRARLRDGGGEGKSGLIGFSEKLTTAFVFVFVFFLRLRLSLGSRTWRAKDGAADTTVSADMLCACGRCVSDLDEKEEKGGALWGVRENTTTVGWIAHFFALVALAG